MLALPETNLKNLCVNDSYTFSDVEHKMNFDIVDGKLVKKLSTFTLPNAFLMMSLIVLLFSLNSAFVNVINNFHIWPEGIMLALIAIIPLLCRTELYIDEKESLFYSKISFLFVLSVRQSFQYRGKLTKAILSHDKSAANWKVYMQCDTGDTFFVYETIDKRKASKVTDNLNNGIILQ